MYLSLAARPLVRCAVMHYCGCAIIPDMRVKLQTNISRLIPTGLPKKIRSLRWGYCNQHSSFTGIHYIPANPVFSGPSASIGTFNFLPEWRISLISLTLSSATLIQSDTWTWRAALNFAGERYILHAFIDSKSV